MNRGRPRGIIVVSFLMILFGLAEVATGITGNFLGVISAATTSTYTSSSIAIGTFYILAGLFILTMKKWGALLAIVFLGADIVGRIALVITGVFPFAGVDAGSIIAGTAIAVIFAFYIGLRWNKFRLSIWFCKTQHLCSICSRFSRGLGLSVKMLANLCIPK